MFCPRIRFQRATARGRVWFKEALFPGYLFARFDPSRMLRAVQYAHGITGLVSFGAHHAEVPRATLDALREWIGEDEVRTVRDAPEVGDEVRVLEGPFQGLEVLVTGVLPASERVRVLLDFLGRQTEVELAVEAVCAAHADPRVAV